MTSMASRTQSSFKPSLRINDMANKDQQSEDNNESNTDNSQNNTSKKMLALNKQMTSSEVVHVAPQDSVNDDKILNHNTLNIQFQ